MWPVQMAQVISFRERLNAAGIEVSLFRGSGASPGGGLRNAAGAQFIRVTHGNLRPQLSPERTREMRNCSGWWRPPAGARVGAASQCRSWAQHPECTINPTSYRIW